MIDVHHNDMFVRQKQPIACIEWKQKVYKNTGSHWYKNLCQGSEGAGFSKYYERCGFESSSILDTNVVGTAAIGYLFHDKDNGKFAIANKLYAYSCDVAVMGYPKNV